MQRIVRIIAILNYVSQCITAITKGAQAVADSWPSNSPFTTANNVQENSASDGKA